MDTTNNSENNDEGKITFGPRFADKKILVVEDDDFLSKLIGNKFEKAGCKSIFAKTGEEALQELEESIPDLVLLDIMLPKMTGLDVLKKVKENEKFKNIPVIILSNLGEEKDIKEGMELGALDFLVKANFTLDEIVGKISKVFS